MNSLPDYTRDPKWRLTLGLLLAAVLFAFHVPLADMYREWSTKADYSHGFFVAPFALYLLWTRREMMPRMAEWPDNRGLIPILIGCALSWSASRYNYVQELMQGVGLILALTGVTMVLFSRYSLRWAWPGLLFLIFMFKMPDRFEIAFAFKLRQIATLASNYILQTIGYPSFVAGQQGTVLTVGELRLGVEWACSGLSMVLTFVAVAAAFAILIQRPKLDRILILLSALPIAIGANILRITVTALVYSAGWKRLGDLIIHDLAGWLMMPLALVFIWLELKLLDWLFTIPEPPERDDLLKLAKETATADWQMPADGPRGAGR
ncbi:exosortase [soil metagenome]